MPPKTASARAYRGLSQEERRADRRRRLITAAVELYGERGYRQSSVKAVCEAAGLTERYFYESFGNSEELLIACYQAVTHGVFREISQAAENDGEPQARARAMLHAYFSALRREPRSAQVFLVEIRGAGQAVDAAFNAALRGIAQEVMRILGAAPGPAQELLALGIVGGISQIALHWIQQDYAPPIEKVVEAAMKLGGALLADT
ncbi:transcriptional regulator, TetR family [Noviherbaspirillum humi]|uniref:Transcriptional regulator, TetR family n=1 Tax=Noviherbaspirillum humi TaxID=1688639 RepID=A0A239IBA1_9BURK|nr:TetR/AcrR family transcriptional regulator [Noviherbaspirillum humi]SNS90692.1 transcriptional regulator, TetR family [Noviherbaspirillum humi]